jgi:hypothetical protein
MMRNLRDKLSYANVMATLAVFIALGGTTYAAIRIPPDSVGNRQLKASSVTNGKIAQGAITGSKVAEGTLSGTDINLNALGTVPQAANATNASNANTVGGHAASCPSNTTLIPEAAATDCAAKGGYLPTPMELYSTLGVLHLGNGLGPSQHQFTDDLYSAPHTDNEYTTIVINGNGAPTEQPAGDPSAYYCAYPLVR